MGAIVLLDSMRFGRLTVLGRSTKKSNVGAVWDCVCDCGGSASVNSLKLRTGHTKSCGCLKREVIEETQAQNLKHGMANKTKTYKTWKCMRHRCNNENSDQWEWYGGRGIKICKQWDDFEVFLADMGERPIGTTIDRIDSDGDYEPSNCRWATPKQQAENNRGCFKKSVANK